MAEYNSLRNARDDAVISIVLPGIVNEAIVSERTAATRRIGAHNLVRTLVGGELTLKSDAEREALGEVLSRMVANAGRHGVDVEIASPTETTEA